VEQPEEVSLRLEIRHAFFENKGDAEDSQNPDGYVLPAYSCHIAEPTGEFPRVPPRASRVQNQFRSRDLAAAWSTEGLEFASTDSLIHSGWRNPKDAGRLGD